MTKVTDFSGLNAADKMTLFHLQQEQINLLKEKNKRLEARLKTLESKLSKNSANSSKPPSSDKHHPGKKPLAHVKNLGANPVDNQAIKGIR